MNWSLPSHQAQWGSNLIQLVLSLNIPQFFVSTASLDGHRPACSLSALLVKHGSFWSSSKHSLLIWQLFSSQDEGSRLHPIFVEQKSAVVVVDVVVDVVVVVVAVVVVVVVLVVVDSGLI